ncbi:P-loop NTPase [Paenibacillus sp. FSL R7-0198]|uniref:nucleotide-binding protein n=1 Tax=Paenibacillus sp. FSL R7-0198 TaxID=2921674 RepID=UPI0030F83D61
MARVICITSGKGGVGKTTVTANLGTALALSGSSVCLIDADFGLRNLDIPLGLSNRVIYHISDFRFPDRPLCFTSSDRQR